MPIVQNSFIDELTLSAGYRKSWYKLSNGRKYDTDTYKLVARVRSDPRHPLPRFVQPRGSCSEHPGAVRSAVRRSRRQRTIRAPSVAITAADFGCLAQGLAVGQSPPANPAGQYNGLLGGNPNLKPEKGTTKTLGVVIQPRFIPRFAMTVDYWNIKLEDAIQGFGADAILTDCVDSSTATFTSPRLRLDPA